MTTSKKKAPQKSTRFYTKLTKNQLSQKQVESTFLPGPERRY
jgi:hypothetical protein